MMKALVLTFTAAAVLLAGGQADEAALKKEKARLKGTWKITKFQTPQGEDENWRDAMLILGEDGSLELRKGDDTKKATFKLNPAAKPKEIDVTPDEDANKVIRGIYALEKDLLKLCIHPDNNNSQRPTEFKAGDGIPHILVTLEKAK
jgi:uncharacterized protein (TIGR03067 family)